MSVFLCAALQPEPARSVRHEEALNALWKGVEFFRSLSVQGGYGYYYSLDLKERWGENKLNATTVEVQAPGTPAVGQVLLRAYRITGERTFLEVAREAAGALIKGQNRLGGWTHTIDFAREPENRVSFDDNQTQGAISFLMALDQVVDDTELSSGVVKALSFMLKSQMEHGGWPHQFPRQGNYHDFATFNDGGINDCIRVMLEASRHYNQPEYLESLRRVARFLLLSQLPPPQPGWAQQYNDYLQPAWARSFEPPSVCPLVTIRNIHSLIDLYQHMGDTSLMEPIPDALSWLENSRLPNGKWARFVELNTGKPLYYDRGRIRVNSVAELSLERRTGYGYEQDLSSQLAAVKARYRETISNGRAEAMPSGLEESSEEANRALLARMETEMRKILDSQDSQGRWVTYADRFRKAVPGERWAGQYRTMDRISSRRFIENISRICDYLELFSATESTHPLDQD